MKPGLLVVAALALRWRRWPARPPALALAAVIALGVWGSGAIHLPSLESVSRDIGATLGFAVVVVAVIAVVVVWRRQRERPRQMGVTPHSHGASHPVRSGAGRWPGANPTTAKEKS